MRSGLRHGFVEALARSLPVSSLHPQESGCSHHYGELVDPPVGSGSQYGPAEWVGKQPAGNNVSGELATQLLQLPVVELLHLEHLPFGQVVILYKSRYKNIDGDYIYVGEPVPVLVGGEGAELVFLVEALGEPGGVELPLHVEDHLTLIVIITFGCHD